MFRLRFATLLSFLFAISSMTVHNANEADDESLSLFDDAYIAQMEKEISDFSAQQKQEVLSKLGKLALYTRLYRSWIRSPITGHRGFEKYFPEPQVRFNAEIYDSCSERIMTCIQELFCNIQKRATLLFPRKGQHIESFTLDEDVFRRTVTNGLFTYDVSVSYLMCFLTKKKLSLFARIPFCAYGVDKSQLKIWPSAAFKDYKSRDEFSSNEEGAEPLDDLSNQDTFQCADESFCPDPCCGRITGRSSSDNFNEAFCANSAYDEKCINTVGGYQCVCKLGYLREAANGHCVPVEFKYEDLYYGPFEQE
ncbi:hypothetical protein Ddc_01690 [Ditylenchus destructor]|nr:hypothetical protein Ddc_01690 [Ditylenchus destructor]